LRVLEEAVSRVARKAAEGARAFLSVNELGGLAWL